MSNSQFIKLLKLKNITLTNKQLKQFEDYKNLLQEYNQKINLTAIVEDQEIYIKHFYDSIIPSFHKPLSGKILDVGSGAGFPSIPLKIMYPNLEVVIVEPILKRVNFLKILAKTLEIDVTILNKRAEDFIKESSQRYDFVFARAVANMQVLSELCIPFVKVDGYFVAMKGSRYQEELDLAKNALKVLGGSVEEIFIDDLDDAIRANIFIKKVKITPNKYPRNYSLIKNKPL